MVHTTVQKSIETYVEMQKAKHMQKIRDLIILSRMSHIVSAATHSRVVFDQKKLSYLASQFLTDGSPRLSYFIFRLVLGKFFLLCIKLNAHYQVRVRKRDCHRSGVLEASCAACFLYSGTLWRESDQSGELQIALTFKGNVVMLIVSGTRLK